MKFNINPKNLRIWLLAGLCHVVFLADGILNLSYAQESSGASISEVPLREVPLEPDIEGPVGSDPVVPVEMYEDLSRLPIEVPLREVAIIEVPLREAPFPEGASLVLAEEYSVGPPLFPQEAVGMFKKPPRPFSTPNPNFDGIRLFDSGAGFIPPDTNGDVGPDHYIQTVNSSIAVFDKEGNTLAGPMPINTLFVPLGGPCATGSVIDPIVNYDPLADRWVVMGFPFRSPICVAVSQTNNPVTGGWFLYAFDVTAFGFPDYPKLGVWPDAYYMTTQRGFPGGGLDVYALDREEMLSGNPATFVHFFVAPPSLFLLPADLDGPRPPAGTPAPFVRHVDGDQWGGVDRLEVFEFSVNFQHPPSSTFNFIVDLPTDAFTAILCGSNFFGNCAEQPNGIRVETLPAWLMWRLQYRNFGTHETLVANHTIDVDGMNHSGVRWYELRRTGKCFRPHRSNSPRSCSKKKRGGEWAIFQQGTFAPQDPVATSYLHRWMGSIAMDKKGNMALGFSAASSTLFPSVRYVGRMLTDPLGSMPRGAAPDGDLTMVSGEGSQFATRWGDYSSMNIDPVDGCTFWYTQEYIGANSFWRTRIGAFKFPSCVSRHHRDSPDADHGERSEGR